MVIIFQCVAEDNLSTAELIMKQGVDVNCLDDDWWTPLHLACSMDLPEMVQLLLSVSIDEDIVNVRQSL